MIAPAWSGAAVLGVYIALSLLSLALYGFDKSAARRGGRRIPESTLHVLAVAGGWPGALIAQRVFRHKTRKQPFRTIFWCTVAANCIALAVLLAVVPR